MEADTDRILGKIKKCLALAASDNPGEAAAALRQAKKLMDKYGFTESQVKLSEVKSVQTGKAPPARDRASRLAVLIAEAFSCRLIMHHPSVGGAFDFIGKGHYPELASYTYSVLWRRLDMESKAFHEQMLCSLTNPKWDASAEEIAAYHGVDVDHYEVRYEMRRAKTLKKEAAEEARKATTSFCEGWLYRVSDTVDNFAGHEPDQDVHDWIANRFGKLKSHKSRTNRDLDADGIQAGIDAGSRVSLHHGVNGKPTGQHLLA
jgi:hypothetical protein